MSDMDCVNVFVDQGDVEDNLPEFFDVNMVNKSKGKNCYLCQTEFGKIRKKRINCKMCGQSCCDLCTQNIRRLSKIDKKQYQICDRCDHQMSNKLFRDKLKDDIKRKQELTQEVIEHIEEYSKKLRNVDNIKKKHYQTWDQAEKDMKEQQEALAEQVAQVQKEKEELINKNAELDAQMKKQQDEIEKQQNEILEKKKLLDELTLTKQKMQTDITKKKHEVKMRNSELTKQQKIWFDNREDKDEQPKEVDCVSGIIDPKLMKEWIEDNNNSETSKDYGSESEEVEANYKKSVNMKRS